MTTEIQTGTAVRVIAFQAQRWDADAAECLVGERNLLANYLGKVGLVVEIDDKDMPYRVEFGEGAGVPLSEMRFHHGEVEDVG